jgi:hypothetical protein
MSRLPDGSIKQQYLNRGVKAAPFVLKSGNPASCAAFNWAASLITISRLNGAVGSSLILLARCEGGNTGGIEVFPYRGTGFLAIPRNCQRTTHHWTNL